MADALNTGEESPKASERRLHRRQTVRSLAYIELDQDNGGIVLDACEGGLAVQAAMSLIDQPLLKVRMQAPQSKSWIEAEARVVWTGDKRKRAGLQFMELSEVARGQIRQWLTGERSPIQSYSSAGVPSEPVTAAPRKQPDKAVDQTVSHRPAMPQAPPAPPVGGTPTVEFVVGSSDKSGYVLYADPFEHSSTLPRIAAEPPPAAASPAIPPPRSAVPVPPVQRVPPAAPVPSVHVPPVQPDLRASIFGRPAPKMWSGELNSFSYERKQEVAGRLPRLGLLMGLIAALIVLSLGAGWAAGRGAFDGFVNKIQTMATWGTETVSNAAAPTPATTPSPIKPAVPTPTPAISTNSQPAAVPSQPQHNLVAAAPRPADPGLATPAAKPTPSWMQPSTSFPISQRGAATAREALVAPPAVESSNGPDNIVLSSADPTTILPMPRPNSSVGTLQRGELVRRVNPVYPEMAKQQRVEGTVKLHVIVGVSGAVRSVDFVSGPKMLAAAAQSAVAKWLYAPSLLNGRPIEMEYEVSLVFQLPKY